MLMRYKPMRGQKILFEGKEEVIFLEDSAQDKDYYFVVRANGKKERVMKASLDLQVIDTANFERIPSTNRNTWG